MLKWAFCFGMFDGKLSFRREILCIRLFLWSKKSHLCTPSSYTKQTFPGRGESFRKSNNASKGMDCFELLATVAGLLHDENTDGRQKGNQPANSRLAKNENGYDLKNASGYKEKVYATDNLKCESSEDQMGALLCVLNSADEMAEDQSVESGQVKKCLSMDKEQCVNKGVTKFQGITPCQQIGAVEETTIHQAIAEKSSTIVLTGGRDLSELQSRDTQEGLSMKLFCGKETESVNVAQELLLLNAGERTEDVASSEMETDRLDVSSRKYGDKELCDKRDDEVAMSDMRQLTTIVGDAAVGNLGTSFGDLGGASEGREEAGDCYTYGRWIKREVQDGLVLYDESPPLVSSGSSGEAPLFLQRNPCDMYNFQVGRQNEKSRDMSCSKVRDDDDNSSESFIPEVAFKKPLRVSHIKASKVKRMANHTTRNRASVAGFKRKRVSLEEGVNRKSVGTFGSGMACTRQRTTRCVPSKKRASEKLSSVPPNLFVNTSNTTMSLEFGEDGEPPASAAKLRRAKAASFVASPTSAAGPSSKLPSKRSGESNVKLTIKSFTIPELSVDLPESATVANLKRAVMDAAMNLLGGGLRVRVLLQGKKVPDENASLVQVGISHGEKLDSLGFMLEPNPMPASPTSAEDPVLMLSRVASQSRYPVLSMAGEVSRNTVKCHTGKGNGMVEANKTDTIAAPAKADLVNKFENDMKSLTTTSHEPLVQGTGALILHPGLGGEGVHGLALVSMRQKSRSMEIGKRRMRRPFTVAEVEALVHAVEKLGTGRWRDVKLCAFEQAKHRTYVDLKDKWKTLVHTAHIAPHQRRGEPVPQELLDRVIQAHSYWTAQQAKRQAELSL